MKDLKEYITENRTEDLTRKAFQSYQVEDDYSGAGEIFGEIFGSRLGDALSEFIYGLAQSMKDDARKASYLEKLVGEIKKNLE